MVFVKNRLTFATTKQCELLSCDPLVYDATEDTTSQITIPIGGITGDDLKSWAVIEGQIWLIDGTSQQDTYSQVTLEPVWKLFARDHVWDGTTYTTKGEFIAHVIETEYINQADRFYAYPYMTITNADVGSSAVAFKAPADEAGDIYSLADYIADAVKVDNLGFIIGLTKDAMSITIRQKTGVNDTVVFNDGHTLYEGASFGEGSVGKVSVIQNGTTTDYYLNSNNEVVTTVPSPRVEGDWRLISIGDEDDPLEEAKEEFKDTIDSYKIEWGSDRIFNVGDNLRFKLPDGSTHYGKVTYKALKTSDGLYHYKSGSLKTTLTDKVRSVK